MWPQGDHLNARDLKHDLGFGLRFGFPRSATNPTLRMDLSYALSGDGAAGDRWLFSLSTQIAFGSHGNALGPVIKDEDKQKAVYGR